MSDSKKRRIGFEMDLGHEQSRGERTESSSGVNQGSADDAPFCIAILGDFSGRDNRQTYDAPPIIKRPLYEVDRDSLEDLMASFDIRLHLWLEEDSDEPIEVPIRTMEDFHPDQLYQNVDIFSQLRSLQTRLKNNNTFADAANQVQSWFKQDEMAGQSSSDKAPPSVDIQEEQLLNSMLEAAQGGTASADSQTGLPMVDKLVKQIVAPYVEPKADPAQAEMLEAVEQAISAHMQFILHHPDFQALEAAWRSLQFLCKRIEAPGKVRVYLLDVAKHELEQDMAEDNVTRSALYKRFADTAPGDHCWGMILGNYRFSDRVEEVMTLLNIGAVARQARAPFISAVNEKLIGCESFAVTPDVDDWEYQLEPEVETAWSLLRNSAEADYLSLVVPGFLLRMPYGKKSSPTESFRFEEMPKLHCHSCYLWGNGAFIKAEQLIRAFQQQGWNMEPATARDIEGLPVHVYQLEGEEQVKPCAEILLTERGGQRILQQGLIPLWSVKNSDRIRSAYFHSLAV